ncbi:MAG TPA: AraC family transcriptional regulator [Candidatus Krumholzibacteria bacterium]|nr:AraC family transcriptional regulator [Candidatus Krumholzibacteria bacterium]
MSRLSPAFHALQQRLRTPATRGAVATGVPGVQFFWVTEKVGRAPLIYSAGIVIIGQGHKIGHLGDRTFRYDEDTYLVLGVPMPFECETHPAADGPLLGLRIDIDLTALHSLVASLGLRPSRGETGTPPKGLEPARMDEDMIEATARLLKCLEDPADSRILGPAAVQEIVYRALRGEQGRVLSSLTQHGTPYAAVARALDRIHGDFRQSISVEMLAEENAMSVSSFHRAFKRVTGDSPLQYLKKIRLDKAKGLLVNQGMRVNTVAFEVGYESPSQFSREFKRYFKVPPSEAGSLAYT